MKKCLCPVLVLSLIFTQSLALPFHKPITENAYFNAFVPYDFSDVEAVQMRAFLSLTQTVGLDEHIAQNFNFEVYKQTPTSAKVKVHLPNGEFFDVELKQNEEPYIIYPFSFGELKRYNNHEIPYDVPEKKPYDTKIRAFQFSFHPPTNWKAMIHRILLPAKKVVDAIDPNYIKNNLPITYADTYYSYDLPNLDLELSESGAIGITENYFRENHHQNNVDCVDSFFDVTNPNQHLWKLIMKPSGSHQMFKVMIDAKTNAVLSVEKIPPQTSDENDVDYTIQYMR